MNMHFIRRRRNLGYDLWLTISHNSDFLAYIYIFFFNIFICLHHTSIFCRITKKNFFAIPEWRGWACVGDDNGGWKNFTRILLFALISLHCSNCWIVFFLIAARIFIFTFVIISRRSSSPANISNELLYHSALLCGKMCIRKPKKNDVRKQNYMFFMFFLCVINAR